MKDFQLGIDRSCNKIDNETLGITGIQRFYLNLICLLLYQYKYGKCCVDYFSYFEKEKSSDI